MGASGCLEGIDEGLQLTLEVKYLQVIQSIYRCKDLEKSNWKGHDDDD